MIVFSTVVDEQTEACNRLIQTLDIRDAKVLFAGNAVKEQLEAEIVASNRNMYAMSHGGEGRLIGNDSCSAVDINNAALFKGKSVFAFACHTSTTLGSEVAAAEGNWFGYVGPIASPDSTGAGLAVFNPIFQYIYDNFAEINSIAECDAFIEELKTLCDSAESLLDTYYSNEEVSLSSFFCAKNIWERLRVWLAREIQSVAHPRATVPLAY